MSPAPVPVYRTDASLLPERLLLTVRFGEETRRDAGALVLALPPLGGTAVENWSASAPVTRGEIAGVAFAHDGSTLAGVCVEEGEDVEAAARSAYSAIVRAVREAGYPFLVRAWNHVRDINAGEGDAERYKRFCAGRYDALTAAGYEKPDFPAASAVGMRDGSVAVYFIAAALPGTNVENPRQMSAYDYPRQYGVRSPSFARATIAGGVVFVSGTASVVGHETRHAENLRAQAEETLANLAGILAACGAGRCDVRAVKVYVRQAADADPVAAWFGEAFPGASVLLAQSDICRRDLLLEAEVVARLP